MIVADLIAALSKLDASREVLIGWESGVPDDELMTPEIGTYGEPEEGEATVGRFYVIRPNLG